jgi:hypothetical protein
VRHARVLPAGDTREASGWNRPSRETAVAFLPQLLGDIALGRHDGVCVADLVTADDA